MFDLWCAHYVFISKIQRLQNIIIKKNNINNNWIREYNLQQVKKKRDVNRFGDDDMMDMMEKARDPSWTSCSLKSVHEKQTRAANDWLEGRQ